ncbi:MAG: hypothetical protein U0K80_01090 [Methanobrevibacter sp.]|nr:hypothetical protein [Methanobrevibacter sp.]
MAKKAEHSHDYGYNGSAYKNAVLVIIATPQIMMMLIIFLTPLLWKMLSNELLKSILMS